MVEQNIEASLVAHLTPLLDCIVATDVPDERPERFITVERVGGGFSGVGRRKLDRPMIAVQCWAPTRLEAGDLAIDVSEALQRIKGCNVTNVNNFPDEKQPRYQVLCIMTKMH